MPRRRRKKHKLKQAKKSTARTFSLTFLLAIPGNFFVGAVSIVSIFGLTAHGLLNPDAATIFAVGCIGSLCILGTTEMPKWRTFLHELKHAVVVIMTGNRVKDFHVDTHTGHVKFKMYTDRLHFAPFITLAPYCLPIFSFPCLLACIVLEGINPVMLAFALGFTLAADMQTAYADLHPHQSDLRKVTGGPIASLFYLAGAHFAWVSLTLIWVVGGRSGYIYAVHVLWEMIKQLGERIY